MGEMSKIRIAGHENNDVGPHFDREIDSIDRHEDVHVGFVVSFLGWASLFSDYEESIVRSPLEKLFFACFIGAMGLAAGKMKITLPADLALDAEVDLGTTGGAYFLQARLNVSLPGLEREVAQALVDAAHQTCPYSKATRGNIDVVINLV
jgi:uncharacterized OsmC-like protein